MHLNAFHAFHVQFPSVRAVNVMAADPAYMVHDGAYACIHGRRRAADFPWVAQIAKDSGMVQGCQTVRYITGAESPASENLVCCKVDAIQL